MRNLFLGTLVGLALLTPAVAADLRYGWDRPPPPAPAQAEDDENEVERPTYREPTYRRPPPPRYRVEEQYDEEDEPQCWIRRTPYGPERICR